MKMNVSDSEQSESIDADESDSNSSVSETSECSSTQSTTDTVETRTDVLELAQIGGELFRLPRGLCENPSIFCEFFSEDTWRLIPVHLQEQLQDHLPRFSHILGPEEAYTEAVHTISMLFKGELCNFGRAPLETLQRQLEEGNCRPDVLKLRQSIAKSKRREQRFQTCERLSRVAKELLISRERLLRNVIKAPPDSSFTYDRLQRVERPFSNLYDDTKLYAIRARKRFHREIDLISKKLGLGYLSADEEDEFLNASTARQIENDIQELQSGAEEFTVKSTTAPTDKCIYSTFFKRRHNMDDERAIRIDQRNCQVRLSNRNFRECLLKHKRRKLMDPTLPEFETADIRLRDVYARAQMGGNFKHIFASGKGLGRKPKVSKTSQPNEPPALVPIQPGFNINDLHDKNTEIRKFQNNKLTSDNKDNLYSDISSNFFKIQHNLSAYQNEMLADNEVFNIMDSEVELQQEEVQTYGTCEETIPAFVISNENHDIVLPPNVDENNKIDSESMQHDEQSNENRKLIKLKKTDDDIVQRQQIPKLEPLSNINKLSNKDRALVMSDKKVGSAMVSMKNSLPAMVTLTPLRKSPTLNFAPPYIANTELIQETHSCFFSLIRDFFCATPNHRMKFSELKKKTDVWLCNPITALNDWYSQAENWSSLLISAINFLAGDFKDQPDEYVPYIEFKTQLNIYQWIGAGRDSDARLLSLCKYWMQRRNDMFNKHQTPATLHKHDSQMALIQRRRSIDIEDASTCDGGISPPPPPRCPTTWSVRAANAEEVAEFQRQERERFENPHRAYTYRMHDYESVVGPVKGIYSQIHALTKARGHSMMVVDRPNFVTILTLVRDATARLPNGEGTRAEISELLKCSQYINRDAAENVLQTIVSGALDRMHTENDPCVRYDPKRKIWIYLHRNRSEEEFERMHQQSQSIGKQKKQPIRKHKNKLISKDDNTIDGDGSLSADHSPTMDVVNSINNASMSFSLPALVPTLPIIVNSQASTGINHTQQKQQILAKCPPVPPLKYNIPNQPNQKSLLKTTLNALDSQTKEATVELSGDQHTRTQIRSLSALNAITVTGSGTNALKTFKFSSPQSRASLMSTVNASSVNSNIGSSSSIIVATPSGLQTVHVSNATSTLGSQASSPISGTLKHSPQSKTTALSATIGGKKVALNKPIFINQITQQTSIKTKNQKQQTQQIQMNQQQAPHSFIIPISMANTISSGVATEGQRQTIFVDNSQVISTDVISNNGGTGNPTQQQMSAKNIIRLVPSKSVAGGSKSILAGSSMVTPIQQAGGKQPVQIIGQRIINATIRQQAGKAGSGSPVAGGISPITQMNTSNIVKLSPQTFTTLQQKHGQQIVLKPTTASSQLQQQQQGQQHRIVVGNSTQTTNQSPTNKNIILKQVPVTVTTQKFSSVQNNANNMSPSQTTVNLSQPVTKRIQAINANSLTPQQQRVLLQNLKQQQSQQHQQLHGGMTKAVIVSQPQVITRFLKTSPTTSNTQYTINKQGATLKINSGKPVQDVIMQTQQQSGQQQQYTVVSQGKNIISLGSPGRVITTQAGNTGTVLSPPAAGGAGSAGVQIREANSAATNSTTVNKIISANGGQVQTLSMPHARILQKLGTTGTTSSSAATCVGNIRLVNANSGSNFNLGSKQVVFASKSATSVGTVPSSQTQELQNTGIIIGTQPVKLQGNANSKLGGVSTQNTQQMQTVLMGNQILRLQQMPQTLKVSPNRAATVSSSGSIPVTTISNSNTSNTVVVNNDTIFNNSSSNLGKTLVLGSTGQAIRLQSTSQTPITTTKSIVATSSQQSSTVKSATPSRVVLAVQGGGQIFLSPTFQGNALNLKTLQNIKMVSLGQASSAKDNQIIDKKSTSTIQAQK